MVRVFKGCSVDADGRPDYFNDLEIEVNQIDAIATKKMLDAQADSLALQCVICEPLLVLPDWMPAKWANMSKLVVLYAEKDANGKYKSAKYTVTIPHWAKGKESTKKEDFPVLPKGQYQSILEFPDGSKITLNAKTVKDAKDAMIKICEGLEVGYKDAVIPEPGLRGGKKIAEITVYPVEARYFVKGNQDLTPAWSVDFRSL